MRLKLFIICIIVVFILSINVLATNITLTPSIGNGKDKYCFENCENSNELIITDNHSLSNAYVLFDLSDVPQNADISIAVLLFKLKTNDPFYDNIAKIMTVSGPWQEDDNQKPMAETYIEMLNNYSCGNFCNNEGDWVGISGNKLIDIIKVMIAGSNEGFMISESNINFSVYSSENAEFNPILFLEYESNCVDADNDGFGYGDCLDIQDCNDTNKNINPNSTEFCNYIDDDCNLLIDDTGYECKTCNQSNGYICQSGEFCKSSYIDVLDTDNCCIEECETACVEGDTKECGKDIGECKKGIQVCHKKEWGKCINESKPVLETCNNKDDDCNGIIDDTEYFFLCECYNGSLPKLEIHDEIDNDCDGEIDENTTCEDRDGFECLTIENCMGTILTGTDLDFCCSQECLNDCTSNESKPCGNNVGSCKEGIVQCVNGLWGECQNAITPTNETCNNIDDDCNGVIDDINDPSKCMCYNSSPINELCNEIDDNCNEMIDEDCIEITVACNDGIKNYNEEEIDCGGFCLECKESSDNNSNLLNQNNDEQELGNTRLEPIITTNSNIQNDNQNPILTFNRIIIFLLIFIALIVIGIVLFEIFFSKKSNQNSKRLYHYVNNKTTQQNNLFSSQQMNQSRLDYTQNQNFTNRKINRYDSILKKSKKQINEAQKLRDKINKSF